MPNSRNPKIGDALFYSPLGTSQTYCAAYLGKVVIGNLNQDNSFDDKSITLSQRMFFRLTQSLMRAKHEMNQENPETFEEGK